jgi:hypothetical protein
MPTSRAELEAAVSRKRLEDAVAAKRAGAPTPEATSPGAAFAHGAGQGLTFGFSDELLGGAQAAYDAATSPKTFEEAYPKRRDSWRADMDKAKRDAPWSYGTGSLAGSVASGFLPGVAPVKGASLLTNAARAALGGAATGAGMSNDDAGSEGFYTDMIGGGILAGGLGAGAQKLGNMATALKPTELRKTAQDRAVKAITGNKLKAIRDMRNTGAASGTSDALESAGKQLLAMKDAAGKKVMGWFSNVDEMVPKLAEKQKVVGQKLGELADDIDNAAPGVIKGEDIAKKIRGYAKSLPETGQTEGVIRRLEKEARRYDPKPGRPGIPAGKAPKASVDDLLTGAKPVGTPAIPGTPPTPRRIGFNEANDLKNRGYKFKPMDSSTHNLGQEGSNELNSIVRTAQNDAAERIANDPKMAQGLREQAGRYRAMKDEYQATKNLTKYGQDQIDRNLSNRAVSPSDHAAAATTALAGAVKGASAGQMGLTAAAAAMLNNQIRQRGNAFAARGASALADILEKSPDQLGRFSNTLLEAAKRSPNALIVTHQMLMKDPEYRDIVGEN